MPIPLSEESALLDQLAEGSEAAFNEIYHRFSPTIYNTIMLYVKYEEQADDLLQMVFIRIWEKRTEMSLVRSLDDYLFIVTRNIVLNHLRKLALNNRLLHHVEDISSSTTAALDSILEEREIHLIFFEAVKLLPERQKEVYLLITQGSLSYDEVAHQLRLSRLTVKKHLELARRFVRSYMKHHLHCWMLMVAMLAGAII